ncbi:MULTISPECIES: hypothetical protein [unclassified Frondihabitans]|uniref:hypothetical protein n=1 Tax=unclassified Frondihabitans TaxID=2626248 RepID=UPI000F4E4307|nr:MULTISPECIES: hypothetical protein [unclassified Frondihabitans]RPE76053.1 hypothetical protein EDF37_1871 [Frondihabitans sp. PhB153]
MTTSPRRVIRVFPSAARRWPLWETGTDAYTTTPRDYGLSPELTKRMREWFDAWEIGFDYNLDRPQWRPGHEAPWLVEGAIVVEKLREEVREFADVEWSHD